MNIRIKDICKVYSDTSIGLKATLWYALCNVLQKGILFILTPVYVRILTPVEYGNYTVFLSWKSILGIFATFNLSAGVFTKAMVTVKNKDEYISSMQGLTLVIASLCYVAYIIFNKQVNILLETDFVTMTLLFLFYVFEPCILFWQVRHRVEYKYKEMVVITIALAIVAPLMGLGLFYVTNLREKAIIWGTLLAQIIAGTVFFLYQLHRGKKLFIGEYWKHAIGFNIPLIPHYLSLLVLNQSDRIMIKWMCGAAAVACYSLAYQISLVMNVLIGAINGSLTPFIYECLKNKRHKEVKKITTRLFVILGLLSMLMMLIAPDIIRIIGTEEYYDSVVIVPAVILSTYFSFCYGIFSTIEFFYDFTKYVMIASSIGAVLNIILNWIFIRLLGYYAAGYTTAFCYFVFLIMHYIFAKRTFESKENETISALVNIRALIVYITITIAYTVLCILIYKNDVIRYGFIIIGCVLLFVFRNKVKDVVRLLILRGRVDEKE